VSGAAAGGNDARERARKRRGAWGVDATMSAMRVAWSRAGGPRTATIAVVGLAVAVIAPILILAAPGRGVTLPAALVFAALGFGPTVTAWLDSGDAFAQLALTVAISLAGYALAAALLIWAHAWHPDLILLLAIPSALSCLRRLGSRPPRRGAAGFDPLTVDVD
jgi:hypothetical protein